MQRKIASSNYVIIQYWMKSVCGNQNECMAYALIYGFTQDNENEFTGSISYIQEWLGVTRKNVFLILQRLEKKGLIQKRQEIISGVTFNRYKAIIPAEYRIPPATNSNNIGSVITTPTQCYNDTIGSVATTPPTTLDNIVDNIIDNNTTPSISIFPPIGENTLIPPEGECESSQQIEEVSKDELEFDKFRKVYRGTKRGLKTEFENFKKKHRDWREVLKTLQACYEHQCELKDAARKKGCFVPQEKNLQTYINQRCWEEEPQFAPPAKEKEDYDDVMREVLLGASEICDRRREFERKMDEARKQQNGFDYEPPF